jgi:type IV pilus assembly protein PilA
MAFLICSNCERLIEATGAPVGSSITCSCGNIVVVPKPGMSRTKRNVLIAVVLAFPCIGLFANTIYRFIHFADRARQSECHSNLKGLYTALKTSDHAAPGSELTFSQIGFSPERGNRYSYFLGAGPMEDRSRSQAQGSENARAIGVDTFRFQNLHVYTLEDLPRDLASQIGVTGTGKDRDFVVACAGDIDNDPSDAPDVWSIASRERTINGERVQAGEPYCHVGDHITD